jgi:hypothetical protein
MAKIGSGTPRKAPRSNRSVEMPPKKRATSGSIRCSSPGSIGAR